MTPLAKIGHEESNGDKMTPLVSGLPDGAQEVVGLVLEHWHGALNELSSLLENARFDHSYSLQDALDDVQGLGWRGSLHDLVRAWLEDPDRVQNLVWYGRQNGWGAGLLRNALRSGEWPPQLMPGSPAAVEAERRRFLEDPYAAFYE